MHSQYGCLGPIVRVYGCTYIWDIQLDLTGSGGERAIGRCALRVWDCFLFQQKKSSWWCMNGWQVLFTVLLEKQVVLKICLQN